MLCRSGAGSFIRSWSVPVCSAGSQRALLACWKNFCNSVWQVSFVNTVLILPFTKSSWFVNKCKNSVEGFRGNLSLDYFVLVMYWSDRLTYTWYQISLYADQSKTVCDFFKSPSDSCSQIRPSPYLSHINTSVLLP